MENHEQQTLVALNESNQVLLKVQQSKSFNDELIRQSNLEIQDAKRIISRANQIIVSITTPEA